MTKHQALTILKPAGNTYEYKKEIKATGFKFSKNKEAWYYHENAFNKFSKKNFSMDEIRSKFGSQDLYTKEAGSLI